MDQHALIAHTYYAVVHLGMYLKLHEVHVSVLQGSHSFRMPCWFRQLTVDTIFPEHLRTHEKRQNQERGEDAPREDRDE